MQQNSQTTESYWHFYRKNQYEKLYNTYMHTFNKNNNFEHQNEKQTMGCEYNAVPKNYVCKKAPYIITLL